MTGTGAFRFAFPRTFLRLEKFLDESQLSKVDLGESALVDAYQKKKAAKYLKGVRKGRKFEVNQFIRTVQRLGIPENKVGPLVSGTAQELLKILGQDRIKSLSPQSILFIISHCANRRHKYSKAGYIFEELVNKSEYMTKLLIDLKSSSTFRGYQGVNPGTIQLIPEVGGVTARPKVRTDLNGVPLIDLQGNPLIDWETGMGPVTDGIIVGFIGGADVVDSIRTGKLVIGDINSMKLSRGATGAVFGKDDSVLGQAPKDIIRLWHGEFNMPATLPTGEVITRTIKADDVIYATDLKYNLITPDGVSVNREVDKRLKSSFGNSYQFINNIGIPQKTLLDIVSGVEKILTDNGFDLEKGGW